MLGDLLLSIAPKKMSVGAYASLAGTTAVVQVARAIAPGE